MGALIAFSLLALLGRGFSDVRQAAHGIFVTSADGTVRRVEGDDLPVAVWTGSSMLGLAVSSDGMLVAAVGETALALSRDGGRTFRVQPTPGGSPVYAAAYRGRDLFLFDLPTHLVKPEGSDEGPRTEEDPARAFRARDGKRFERVELPPATGLLTAVFADARRGYVAGGSSLLMTADGGSTWRALKPPTSAQGVLAADTALFVSGSGGVWRSDDGGRSFAQVLELSAWPSNCSRMAAHGDAVAVACAAYQRALWYAPDGRHFRLVPVPGAAHLTSVLFAGDGSMLAVGSHELFIRAGPDGGRIAWRSDAVSDWLRTTEQMGPGPLAPPPPPPAAVSPWE